MTCPGSWRSGSSRDDQTALRGASAVTTFWYPRKLTLSVRERAILNLLARGRRSSEIAADLVISNKTVSSHIHNILAKLRVQTQAQAVAAAYRAGVVDLEARVS